MARKGQDTEILHGGQDGVGGEDFLRSMVERVAQQVLEAEMTSFLGADNYERNAERRGWRNGYKPRTLKTRVGELELMVPKDRDGEYQTERFERYQRSEKALVLAMLQMCIEDAHGNMVLAMLPIREVIGSALALPLNVTAHAWLLVSGDRGAGQHRVESCTQVCAGDRTRVTGPAVIELSPVDEAVVPIEEVKVRRASGPIGFGHLLAFVVEIGEGIASLLNLFRHLLRPVPG
jgi:Transposase, Mutator family